MGIPKEKTSITALGQKSNHGVVEKIELIGSDEKLSWSQKPDALIIKASAHYPTEYAVAYRLILKK